MTPSLSSTMQVCPSIQLQNRTHSAGLKWACSNFDENPYSWSGSGNPSLLRSARVPLLHPFFRSCSPILGFWLILAPFQKFGLHLGKLERRVQAGDWNGHKYSKRTLHGNAEPQFQRLMVKVPRKFTYLPFLGRLLRHSADLNP